MSNRSLKNVCNRRRPRPCKQCFSSGCTIPLLWSDHCFLTSDIACSAFASRTKVTEKPQLLKCPCSWQHQSTVDPRFFCSLLSTTQHWPMPWGKPLPSLSCPDIPGSPGEAACSLAAASKLTKLKPQVCSRWSSSDGLYLWTSWSGVLKSWNWITKKEWIIHWFKKHLWCKGWSFRVQPTWAESWVAQCLFSNFIDAGSINTYLVSLSWWLNKIPYLKSSAEQLTYSEHLKNGCYG